MLLYRKHCVLQERLAWHLGESVWVLWKRPYDSRPYSYVIFLKTRTQQLIEEKDRGVRGKNSRQPTGHPSFLKHYGKTYLTVNITVKKYMKPSVESPIFKLLSVVGYPNEQHGISGLSFVHLISAGVSSSLSVAHKAPDPKRH
ncbi:unnamed protein product [Caretta caretta]